MTDNCSGIDKCIVNFSHIDTITASKIYQENKYMLYTEAPCDCDSAGFLDSKSITPDFPPKISKELK